MNWQRNGGRGAATRPAQPFQPAPAQVQRRLIEQLPSQARIQMVEDRTAILMECMQQVTSGRTTMGYCEIAAHMGGVMPELERLSRLRPMIAIIRNIDDDCLATPDCYPEAPFAMRWAASMMAPTSAPGWQRYIPVVQQAVAVQRVVLLEADEDKVPSWLVLWNAARAPEWAPRLSW